MKSLEGADGRLDPARPVDGLGERLLHVQRHEHRVHLAVPEADARARSGLHGSPLDRVVPALRHVALAARADPVGRLPGPRRPVAHRSLPARRPPGRVARDLDDDAVDAPRERRRRRAPGGALRQARERRVGDGGAVPRRDLRGGRVPGRELVGLRYEGPFDTLPPGAEVEHRVIPWDEVSVEEGTGIVHIAPGCGGEDFELVARPRPADPHAGRRGGTLLRRLRLAARDVDR